MANSPVDLSGRPFREEKGAGKALFFLRLFSFLDLLDLSFIKVGIEKIKNKVGEGAEAAEGESLVYRPKVCQGEAVSKTPMIQTVKHPHSAQSWSTDHGLYSEGGAFPWE